MTHGHSPGVQLRAALCLLALSQRRTTFMREAASEGSWLRLLSLEEQRAFFQLINNGEKVEIDSARAIIDAQSLPRQLVFTDALHLHAGLGADAWVGLIDGPDMHAQGGPLPAHGAKMFQLGTGDRHTLAAGPQTEAHCQVWRLPWPLHSAFCQQPDRAATLGPGLLWIAGPQDPVLALSRLRQTCHQWGGGVHVFDPYGRYDRPDLRAALPRGCQVLGAADARARRSFYAQCQSYCADGPELDPFAIEAQALGLVPWPEGPQPGAQAVATVNVVELMDALLQAFEGAGPHAAPEAVVLAGADGKRLVVRTALAQRPAGPSALLLWGALPKQEAWPALAQQMAAQGCSALFAQVGPHTAFLPALMMAHLQRPGGTVPTYLHRETPEALWSAASAWLAAAPAGAELQVLVPSCDGASFAAARSRGTAWQRAPGAIQGPHGADGALPVIAINSGSDIRIPGASVTQVGSVVASNEITWGTYLAAPQRFEPKWLRYAGKEYDIASQFMHPLTRPVLAQGGSCETQLWSAPTLRLALQHDRVDAIFMAGGPLGSAVQTLRSLYARKPVPWVGVLHGMHSPSFQSDIAAFLLNGPVYPFDGFISPSAGGRTVFLQTWNTLRQWLTRQGHRRVPDAVDVAVIPYGVDTAYFAPRQPLACRQNLRLPPHELLILTLGRISRRFKTCLLPLLISMQQLVAQGVRAQLVIAGALMAKSELTRLKAAVMDLGLTDCVHFRVSVSLEDKAQLLSAADIFVAMSDSCQETHGIAPIEAMAAGLPVVAAAWDGFREIVVHDDTGLLVPTAWSDIPQELFVDNLVDKQARDLGFDDLHETVVTDIAALTHSLATLCRHKEVRRRMGERGRARAQALFDARKQGVCIADYLLQKVAQAQGHRAAFQIPEPYMLVDRVDQRFAHYATHHLDEATEVVAGPRAHDGAYRKLVAEYIGALDHEEGEIIDGIAQAVAQAAKPVPLSSLLGPRVDMLRLMRCLKYNILCLASGPR